MAKDEEGKIGAGVYFHDYKVKNVKYIVFSLVFHDYASKSVKIVLYYTYEKNTQYSKSSARQVL